MAVPVAEPARRYLELLSDADLALLGTTSGLGSADAVAAAELRRRPDLIEPALQRPEGFERLFPPAAAPGEAAGAAHPPGNGSTGLALGVDDAGALALGAS